MKNYASMIPSLITPAAEIRSVFLGPIVAVALATGWIMSPAALQAEIILDDFDDSLEIVLPEMKGQYIEQSGIGSLDANRLSRLNASSGSQPDGRADVNLSLPSALTFEIDRFNPHPIGGLPVVGISLEYAFDEIDITQDGLNDRAVLDFAYLRSAAPLARVEVFIWDRTQPAITYVSQLFSIQPQEDPLRLEFPLDSFGIRGGGNGQIQYKRVYGVGVSIYPAYFSGPDAISFSMALDRVRFTSAIPEPRTDALVCFVAIAGILLFGRIRR